MAKRKPKTEKRRKRPKAVLYCRVSTFDQNRGDYSSLEDQESRLRRAAEADGYTVFQVFKEVASSANLERDELRKMMGKLDEIDAVYVTKLDRLSRSMHDWCRVNELLDQHDVALVSVTQKIDTSTPMGRFFRDLLMLFAQFEREMIAERTYEKMAEQARLGRWSGGRPILGYDVVDKAIVVNRDEVAIVEAIFDKYLELASIAKTARWANLKGYRTKHVQCKNGREFKARKFTRADIQRMLSNITYIGKIRFDGVEYNGAHDGIIPEEKFLQVQELMAAKKEKPRRGDQRQQETLLLGLLRCGFCGGACTSSFVNKKQKDGTIQRYYYYKCTSKSRRDAEACPSADLRATMIDDAFIQYFRQLAHEPKHLEAVLKAADAASREGVGQFESERGELSKQLAMAERESMTLVDRLADPELAGISAIKSRLSELEHHQQVLKSRITDLTLQIRDRRDQNLSLDEIREAFEHFDEIWEQLEFEERQYAVRLLVKEIQLNFEKGQKQGEMKIQAWGRRPTPLSVELRDYRSAKLRNQDGRHPEQDSNLQHPV